MITLILRHIYHLSVAIVAFAILLWAAEKMIPVVLFSEMDQQTIIDGKFTGRVTAYKPRDCLVVKGSFVGWQKLGEWEETELSFPKDLSPDSSKPGLLLEKQSFGLFRWNVESNATEVKVTLNHNCEGSIRITTVGPFIVKEEKEAP